MQQYHWVMLSVHRNMIFDISWGHYLTFRCFVLVFQHECSVTKCLWHSTANIKVVIYLFYRWPCLSVSRLLSLSSSLSLFFSHSLSSTGSPPPSQLDICCLATPAPIRASGPSSPLQWNQPCMQMADIKSLNTTSKLQSHISGQKWAISKKHDLSFPLYVCSTQCKAAVNSKICLRLWLRWVTIHLKSHNMTFFKDKHADFYRSAVLLGNWPFLVSHFVGLLHWNNLANFLASALQACSLLDHI